MLPKPSEEQMEIILNFKLGYNCKVEAVAGSGKTTTLLLLALEARRSFNAKTLIITYNRDLKDDISHKIRELNISNHCDVYTYHGYASKIYKRSIYNDKILRESLTEDPAPSTHNIILLDEVQDTNDDYHKLITKILKHGDLLVLVGDRRQCINEYMGATSEYLINYHRYYNTGRPWKELSLRTSYRLTPALAEFVNKGILTKDIIIPGNKSNINCKPTYSYGVWAIERLVLESVEKYGSNEVIIMMPSVRNINKNSPIGRLCTKKRDNIMFCVKDGETSEEILQNKVLITSYNSMKGRERKCVIIMGFDESYFEFYDRKWRNDIMELPNILYVACTRAKECMILIQDSTKSRFRTITSNVLYDTCFVLGGSDEQKQQQQNKQENTVKQYSVTDLTRHRNTTDTIDLLNLLTIESIQPPGDILPYRNIIQFNGYFEDMKKYYGILIPLLAEYRKTGNISLIKCPEKQLTKTHKDDIQIIRQYNNILDISDKDMKDWMKLVILKDAINTNYYFYAYQITNYDWVDSFFINTQVDRIINTLNTHVMSMQQFKHSSNHLSGESVHSNFEYPCLVKNEGQWILNGSIDYLQNEGTQKIWEFKCSTSLSDEYKMQCGAYISMYYQNTGNLLTAYLYNTRTEEILNITVKDPITYLNIFMRHKSFTDSYP